ncbi:MAG: hypothetical protein ACRDK3_07180 [Actinomycetota bacterium]
MLSDPTSAAVAGVHSLIVAAAFLIFGYLLIDALLGRLHLGFAITCGLSIAGCGGFVTAMMVAHIVTGGAVLSNPVLTRVITGVVAVVLVGVKVRRARRARVGGRIDGREASLIAGLVVLGLLLWCRPVFSELPLDYRGDTKVHMTWSSQLLNGESTPSGRITGEIPNYYPWLLHGFTAFLAQFAPGGRALHALGPMQVLFVVGSVLALYAAGKSLSGRAVTAVATTVFGALAGGFGWLVARGPALILNPRDPETSLRYWGDLFQKRSYSFAFNNLVPPFPRDLTFALIAVLVVLLVIGLSKRSTLSLVAAGITLGMIGLTGGETFIVGGLTALGVIAFGRDLSLMRRLSAILLPAGAVYSVWLVPLAISYIRLEGFGNTAAGLVTLTPLSVLGAWGIVTPFAVYGGFRWIPKARSDPVALVALVALSSGLVGLVFSSLIPTLFGAGFTTLGRAHRYWPLACFGVVLYGGLGAGELLIRLWESTRTRALAVGAGLAVAGAAVASPWLGSSAIAEIPEDPLLASSMRNDKGTVLNVLSPRMGGSCVVAVPSELSRPVGSYAGYRLVHFPGSTRHQAGIRWIRLPDRIRQKVRTADNQILTAARSGPEQWRQTAQKHEVDIVVIPSDRVAPWILSEYSTSPASGTRRDYVVVLLDSDCRNIPPGWTDP